MCIVRYCYTSCTKTVFFVRTANEYVYTSQENAGLRENSYKTWDPSQNNSGWKLLGFIVVPSLVSYYFISKENVSFCFFVVVVFTVNKKVCSTSGGKEQAAGPNNIVWGASSDQRRAARQRGPLNTPPRVSPSHLH